VSCRAGLNGPTTGPDRAELNGSCRARPTGCWLGPSTARLVLWAGSGPLPVGSCSCRAKSCGPRASPFTTGQIFRTTNIEALSGVFDKYPSTLPYRHSLSLLLLSSLSLPSLSLSGSDGPSQGRASGCDSTLGAAAFGRAMATPPVG
jgi:hypothetical protein